MKLINNEFRVVLHTEEKPQLQRFDVVHNPENIRTDDFYMAHVLEIENKNGNALTVALLDTICSGYEPCAVLEGDIITVILFSSILRVDLNTGMIVQFAACDNMGGLFEIHPIEEGYIIWGEGNVFRYDRHLNQVWRFGGRDILVSPKMDKHFWIDNGLIHCRDFEGWYYVLDLNGNLIRHFREVNNDEIL